MDSLFPFDVIYEILVRLPVKSLIRFKCVCKSWYALIQSSDFIKSHDNYSLETNSNLCLIFSPKLLLGSRFEQADYSWIHSSPVIHNQFYQTTKLYLPLPFTRDYLIRVRIVGSCNGLICIHICSCFALINPSTRMFKFVPYAGRRRNERYGFGYDSLGDDYKIILIVGSSIVVYSLGTNSWGRPIYLSKCPSRDAANAVLVNGRLHWTLSCRKSVLCFDLHGEELSEFSLPNCNYGAVLWWVELGVLDGCLCVTFSIKSSSMSSSNCSDLWVMKEYGVEKSWTKLFRFPFAQAMPLANTKTGCEVLFSKGSGRGLFLWNTEKKTMREIEGPMMNYSQVTACADSLAPLMHDSFILQAEETKKGETHRKEEKNHKDQSRNTKKQRYMKDM